jgi:hypothetical protein
VIYLGCSRAAKICFYLETVTELIEGCHWGVGAIKFTGTRKYATVRSILLSVFWTGNLLRGVPKVDECGLAEIGNSKEETRDAQFRQVRAARCVIPYVLYAA